jgi:hypothetical protein
MSGRYRRRAAAAASIFTCRPSTSTSSARRGRAGIALGTYPIASVTPAMAEIVYGRMIEGEHFRRGRDLGL